MVWFCLVVRACLADGAGMNSLVSLPSIKECETSAWLHRHQYMPTTHECIFIALGSPLIAFLTFRIIICSVRRMRISAKQMSALESDEIRSGCNGMLHRPT